MRVWLFKMNSLSFIIHPSYFILALGGENETDKLLAVRVFADDF
jgi:hypothetical protein